MRSLIAVLPAAVLWGASSPLAIAAVVGPGRDAGRTVGRVYAADTVGGIGGSVLFSVVVIPQLGSQQAERALIGVAIISSAIVFASTRRRPTMASSARRGGEPATRLGAGQFALMAAGVVLAVRLFAAVPEIPDGLIAYGRFLATYTTEPRYLYLGEGMNSPIAVSEEASGALALRPASRLARSSRIRESSES